MQNSYGITLNDQQTEELMKLAAEESGGLFSCEEPAGGEGGKDVESLAEQISEDANGAEVLMNDPQAQESMRILYRHDMALFESKIARLRRFAADKRSFDRVVNALAKAARAEAKELREAERRYLAELNRRNSNHTLAFEGLPDLALPLFSGRYESDGRSIYYNFETEEGPVVRVVFPHAVVPVRIFHNIDTSTEKVRIAFRNENGASRGWRYVTVERELLADSRQIKALAAYGISVNSDTSREVMEYFTTLFDLNQSSERIPAVRSVARMGWIDGFDDFMPYDRSRYEFDGDAETERRMGAFSGSGSAEDWLKAMGAEYRRAQSFPLRIAMAASLGSVLLRPLGMQLFSVELWGKTGTGKTVAIQAAASVWGEAVSGRGLINTLDTTDVGRERLYGFMGDLPVFMDELQTLRTYGAEKTSVYDRMIMHHSGGEGRTRGGASEKLQSTERWCNILLLTGEEPVSKENSSGGARNRVIEVEVRENIFADPGGLMNVISENYGVIGEQWVNVMKGRIHDPQRWKELRERINRRAGRIAGSFRTDRKQALSAAFLLETDRLICEILFDGQGVEPLEDIDAGEFIKDCSSINTCDRAYNDVIAWVAANRACFEEPAEHYNAYPKEAAGRCLGRLDTKGERIIVIASELRRFLESSGYDVKAVTSQWIASGLMEKNGNRNQFKDRINAIVTATYRFPYSFTKP